MQLFETLTQAEVDAEVPLLVRSNHAAPLFMAALTAAGTDIAALKATGTIGAYGAKALLPSNWHTHLEVHAAQTGLHQLL